MVFTIIYQYKCNIKLEKYLIFVYLFIISNVIINYKFNLNFYYISENLGKILNFYNFPNICMSEYIGKQIINFN